MPLRPTDPRYVWDEEAGRYRRASDRRFVDDAVVRNALEQSIRAEQVRALGLAQSIAQNGITPLQFQRDMQSVIANTQWFAAAAGAGGWQQMTTADAQFVEDQIEEQNSWLKALVKDLRAGLPRDGRFLNRTMSYARAARTTYYVMDMTTKLSSGKTRFRNRLHPADHCEGEGSCLEQTAFGWMEPGDPRHIPPGSRLCRGGCLCDMEWDDGTTASTPRLSRSSLTPPPVASPYQTAVADLRAFQREHKQERAIVLDEHGNKVADVLGDERSTDLGGLQILNDPDHRFVQIHNHPHGDATSHSDGDWMFFSWSNIQSVTVVNDRGAFILRKTPEWEKTPYGKRSPAAVNKRWNEIIDAADLTRDLGVITDEANAQLAKELGAVFERVTFEPTEEELAAILAQPGSAYAPANPDMAGVKFDDVNDTQKRFKLPDGTYTADRQALHDAIIRKLFPGIATPSDHQIVYVMGGGPASGKSSMTDQLDTPNVIKVDPDKIKVFLPEFKELKDAGDQLAGQAVHEESSELAKQIVDLGVKSQYNVLIDGTGDNTYENLLGKIAKYRAGGGELVANYVTLDVDEAIRRSDKRARENPDRAKVPHDYIREVYRNISDIIPKAIRDNIFDDLTIWDNSGDKAVPIAHYANGTLDVIDQVKWDHFLAQRDQTAETAEAERLSAAVLTPQPTVAFSPGGDSFPLNATPVAADDPAPQTGDLVPAPEGVEVSGVAVDAVNKVGALAEVEDPERDKIQRQLEALQPKLRTAEQRYFNKGPDDTEARAELQKLVGEWAKLVMQNGMQAEKLPSSVDFEDMGESVYGRTEEDGRVTFGLGILEDMANLAVGHRTAAEWGALDTLVHEAMHVNSPLNANPQVFGEPGGQIAEEITTEALARRITDRLWGDDPLPDTRHAYGGYHDLLPGMDALEEARPGTLDAVWSDPSTTGRVAALADGVDAWMTKAFLPALRSAGESDVATSVRDAYKGASDFQKTRFFAFYMPKIMADLDSLDHEAAQEIGRDAVKFLDKQPSPTSTGRLSTEDLPPEIRTDFVIPPPQFKPDRGWDPPPLPTGTDDPTPTTTIAVAPEPTIGGHAGAAVDIIDAVKPFDDVFTPEEMASLRLQLQELQKRVATPPDFTLEKPYIKAAQADAELRLLVAKWAKDVINRTLNQPPGRQPSDVTTSFDMSVWTGAQTDPHTWAIDINNNVVHDIANFLAGNRTGREWGALEIMLHEGIHVMSPIHDNTEAYTQTGGQFTEELTVEGLARRVTDKVWGDAPLPEDRHQFAGYRDQMRAMEAIEKARPGTIDSVFSQDTARNRMVELAKGLDTWGEKTLVPVLEQASDDPIIAELRKVFTDPLELTPKLKYDFTVTQMTAMLDDLRFIENELAHPDPKDPGAAKFEAEALAAKVLNQLRGEE
jgi:predicted ABC-type ATPase